MSIWTACAGSSEIRPLRARPWRVVEAQHVVATRKLVDDLAEHELLERLLEEAKPPLPREASADLHYLLTTPFRYPPLRHGSRFGTRRERGIWYGSQRLYGALAEVAYYRLVFLEDSAAALGTIEVELSAFRVRLRSQRGIDLGRAPFAAFESEISAPTRYAESQELGRAMREAGVELFRYRSARDPRSSDNVGAFTPRVFAEPRPAAFETWHCVASKARVEFLRKELVDRKRYEFERALFLVDGRLPRPSG